MDLLWLIVRLGLAGVFVVAAVGKVLDLEGSRRAVSDFGVPDRVAAAIGTVLPVLELLLATGMVLQPSAQAAALAGFLLLASFSVAIARLMRRGEAPQCHCFGQLHSEPAGIETLIRNGVLAVGALAAGSAGPGLSVSELSGTEVGTVVVSVVAIGLALATAALWRENRDLRARADGSREPDLGLAVGTRAPDVVLRSIDVPGEVAFSSLMERDRATVLVQVSPFCGPCAGLMPDLSRWQAILSDRLRIVTVSAGDEETNREFARTHGFDGLLFTEGMEVQEAYRALVTPSAILIDGRGRVAGRPVAGAEAIESLIRVQLGRSSEADIGPPQRLRT